ncbi:hypothetical protein C0J52_28093 [Blattella germanica]|nr:hypothetical protein C0J52_28093 [Blattella germanica]
MASVRLAKKQKYESNTNRSEKEVFVDNSLPKSSSSSKKLAHFTNISTESSYESNIFSDESANDIYRPNYMMIHSSTWKEIFKGCVCAACGSSNLCIETQYSMAFAYKLITKCRNCQVVCNESPRVPSNESSRPPFDVNRRIVNGFLEIGKGHAAIEQFSMMTGLPIMSTSTYYSDHIKNIADDNEVMNEFLAVRNAEGSFYICQAMQNIYKSSPRIRIRWLSQEKKDNKLTDVYIPDFYDATGAWLMSFYG